MCPYYLDGDLQWVQLSKSAAPGDTRLHWLLCSFQGPRRAKRQYRHPQGHEGSSAEAGGCRSLKTQQHAARPEAPTVLRAGLPGSVDMLRTGMRSELDVVPAHWPERA